jgi:NitT/TauT family transport system substrate-binding protein
MSGSRSSRSIVVVAAALLVAAATVAPLAAQPRQIPRVAAPATVRMGWTVGSMSVAGVYIAIEKGYFREANITTELVPVGAMGELVGPLSTGELDLGTGGPSVGLFNAVSRGVNLKIVADQNTAFPGRSFFALMVRKDLFDSGEIKSFADFKGRKLGMSTRRTTIELDLQKGLKTAGLDLKDVTIVTMGWPQVNAAFAGKALDVGFQIEPLVTVAVNQNLAVRWKGLDEITPNRQNSFLVASEHFVAKQDLARAWMVAYVRALRDYNDAIVKNKDRETVIQILRKHSSVKDRATYDRMTMPGIHPDGEVNVASIREALDAFKATGEVKPDVDLERMLDLSFVKYAQTVLGRYAR